MFLAMSGTDGSTRSDQAETPSASGDVVASMVDSLYAPIYSLMIGIACSIAIVFTVFERTNQPVYGVCALVLCGVFIARLTLVLAYARRDRTRDGDPASLRRWRLAYAIGAYAFAATLGFLGAWTLVKTDDPVSHMLVLTLNMGLLAGVATRNSGIAVWQIVLTLVPAGLAAVTRHLFAYDILALFIFLSCLGGVEISLHQSQAMLRLLTTRKDKEELAQKFEEQNRRFDAALNNMPQGLCMLDETGRLAVANTRLRQMFRAPADIFSRELSIEDMTESFYCSGTLKEADAQMIARALRGHLLERRAACTQMTALDGRIIAATQAPIEGGGAVIIFDDITERHEADARVRYLATHDILTGLPNRTLFTQMLREEIESAQRDDRGFGVLFIDLDRFKAINDTLGHAAGDALLREVSARLRACLRPEDISARLGGDEFVAIMRDAFLPQDAAAIAAHLLARLNAPMNIAGQECGVSASIGVAFYPADGADEETLLKNADAAMYLAKAEGKSGVRLYSPKVKTQTLQGLILETSMRHALAREEFLVVYQPKRSIASGALTGVEALLRWRHPELGLLSPDRFIPIAEETGLIVPIGKWVLDTACAQQMTWREQGLEPISVAVNLSPRQLFDDHIVHDISDALTRSGMEPEWLELEITESMVMQDAGDAIMVLRAIKELGAKLAIDDFGTGYSSLSLVKRMPLDAIKIDRSFINDLLTDPNDRAIAEAVISLGQALKLRVVAEGVETEAQEAFLRERGCSEMQGFLFSRPVEADALRDFVVDYNYGRLRRLADRERALVKKSA